MEIRLFTALFAAGLATLLGQIVPCALRGSDVNFLVDIRRKFNEDKKDILVNAVIVFIVVFASLVLAPEVKVKGPQALLNFLPGMEK
jgi:hypothetical protein